MASKRPASTDFSLTTLLLVRTTRTLSLSFFFSHDTLHRVPFTSAPNPTTAPSTSTSHLPSQASSLGALKMVSYTCPRKSKSATWPSANRTSTEA